MQVSGICLLDLWPTMAGRHSTKPYRSMSLCTQRWWCWWSYMKCINHRQARLFIYGWGVRNEETLAMRLVCITSLPCTPGTILYHSHVDQGSSTEWLSRNVWQKLLKASITATSRPKNKLLSSSSLFDYIFSLR